MGASDKQQELKKKLSALLSEPSASAGDLLQAASELARLDPDYVWFSVDAGLISRLGTELVARQETALAELIKNAYDADATVVEAIFENCREPGGTLTITDDGNGMTRAELIAGFMRISTSDKVHRPMSPRYHRQRAGRKGVGRFAAQRLGRRLTLITETQEDPFALKVEIDWSTFSPDSELVAIANPIAVISKRKEKGTTLIISGLVDAWSDAKIERAYRYIHELLQPPHHQPNSNGTKPDADAIDPGFVSRFLWENEQGTPVVEDEHSMFLDFRVATIEGWVDDGGTAWCKVDSPRYQVQETSSIESGEYPHGYSQLGGVRLSASYFIVDNEHIPSLFLTRVRRALANSGGIRLYRNGFQVQPYGKPPNDWLELDRSTAQRSILVPHRNRNFFGFIELRDVAGQRFNETSSREGLIENPAFDELKVFGYQVLIHAVLKIGGARGKKVRTHSGTGTKPSRVVREIAAQLAQLTDTTVGLSSWQEATTDARISILRNATEELAARLQSLADAQDREIEEHLKEIDMLRVLASMGLLIGEFTHEIRHDVVALKADASTLSRTGMPDHVRTIASRIQENLNSLHVFTAYFDRTIADNLRRDLRPQDLRDIVHRFHRVIQNRANTQDIAITTDVKGANLLTRPMHPSEWASILFNLFTNAEKAIKKALVRGRVLICAGKDVDRVYLEFADNGCGVPEADRERIFDAFFTTTPLSPPGASDSDGVQGTGLGLKIVRDIVTSAGGTIAVTDAPGGYKTCLRVEVPSHPAQKGTQ